MKQYLKKYSDKNPERFNKDFILSREKQNVLEYIQDIFKALEILDEIKVEEVSLDKDESGFGPIKSHHHYYKSILPSRLDKIHYKIRITPRENIPLTEIRLGTEESKEKEISDESFIKEGDIYINKLIDNCFYINEGVRYFLIYQVVDNSTYGTDEAVSLKSLLMPITLKREFITACPEGTDAAIELPSFEALLFSKIISPIFYLLSKESYNDLVSANIKDPDAIYDEWTAIRDKSLVDKLNSFFGVNLEFGPKLEDLMKPGKTVFKIGTAEKCKLEGDPCFVAVDKNDLENDEKTKIVLGCLLNLKSEVHKKNLVFSYDDFISPFFWVDKIANFFTKNNDFVKKFNKVRAMLISLNRLLDSTTKKVLNLKETDKENTLTIMRYIMNNFEELLNADPQDLKYKRLRLYEYQLYPLRKYFSDQVYRVLNSMTRSKAILDRIFSNLSPMHIIKQTVTSELLRYYNSTNEMNLFSALLKYTFRGPQSLNKTVAITQRDVHPSYAGRISLIASNASDPGMSGTLSPFIEEYNYYFEKQDGDGE